jgi:hypothetical protein
MCQAIGAAAGLNRVQHPLGLTAFDARGGFKRQRVPPFRETGKVIAEREARLFDGEKRDTRFLQIEARRQCGFVQLGYLRSHARSQLITGPLLDFGEVGLVTGDGSGR